MDYILSFDIGIKNLAYCYLVDASGAPPEIRDWHIVDLMEAEFPPEEIPTCDCTV